MAYNEFEKSFANAMIDDLKNAIKTDPKRIVKIQIFMHGKISAGAGDTQFTIEIKLNQLFLDSKEGVLFTRIEKNGRVEYRSIPVKDIRKVSFDLT